MTLTKEEKEITLSWCEADETYEVYCASPKMRTKIENAGYEAYKVDDDGTAYYKLPFASVSIRKPSTRTMSEENKQAAAERMKKMHEKKKEENK